MLQENNELNVVGTTRAVLGRGGEVQCVLTGRDICTIEAIEVSGLIRQRRHLHWAAEMCDW